MLGANDGSLGINSRLNLAVLESGYFHMSDVLGAGQQRRRPRRSRVCSSPPNWPRLSDLSACGSASAACLSTLPHCFAFIFPTFGRTGCAQLGTNTAHAVSECRAAREQGHAGAAQFRTFVAKPDTVPHHDRIVRQGLIAVLRAPT